MLQGLADSESMTQAPHGFLESKVLRPLQNPNFLKIYTTFEAVAYLLCPKVVFLAHDILPISKLLGSWGHTL